MASLAQLTANRLNAQRSTGPRSESGKAASSPVTIGMPSLTTTHAQSAHVLRRNAVRHNLSPGTTFTLLPGEDVSAFEKLAEDYRSEFRPRTAHEVFLVNQMVQAQWRISRLERMQAEVLDIILNVPVADGKSDEAAIVASMPFAHGQTLDKLERYARAAERAYFRANKELKQYRAEKQNEAKSAAATAVSLSPLATRHSPLEQNEPKSSAATALSLSPLVTQTQIHPRDGDLLLL